jgi:hypothetical protein
MKPGREAKARFRAVEPLKKKKKKIRRTQAYENKT